MDFDFTIVFDNGRRIKKSRLRQEDWFNIYGSCRRIQFDPIRNFIVHVCGPSVESIIVKWQDGTEYVFGAKLAKGQKYEILLHNNARSFGSHEPPKHGESQQVYAKTVGIILYDDKQIYTVEFHKNGKAIPSIKEFRNVINLDTKL